MPRVSTFFWSLFFQLSGLVVRSDRIVLAEGRSKDEPLNITGGILILKSITAARVRDAGCPVLVLGPGGDETVFRLRKNSHSIGRGPQVDIDVGDRSSPSAPANSQPWAVLQLEGAIVEVFDLQNVGLSLDGEEFVQAAEIANGARFELGAHEFLYINLNADILPAGLQLLAGVPLGFTPPIQIKNAETDFNEILIDSLKRTPWVLLSLAFHALIFCVALLWGDADIPERSHASLVADFSDDADETDTHDIEDEFDEEPELSDDEVNPDVPEVESETNEYIADDMALDDSADETSAPNELVTGLNGALAGDGSAGGMLGGGLTTGDDANLKRRVGELKSSGLDIVFLIDATSSMDREISSAKRRISGLIGVLEALQIEFRIGVVAFRDRGDEYVTRIAPLTGVLFKSVAFLDEVEASGGDDIPEAVYDAVLAGTKMRWSKNAKRVMVLVGDAPPKIGTLEPTLHLLDAFQAQGGVCHSIFSETSADDYYGARAAFRAIAKKGNGFSMELEDETQIVENLTMLALDTDNRRSVRKLLANLEGGVRARVLRRILQRSDKEFVYNRLRKKGKQPEFALELTRLNARGADRAYLVAYLELLRERDVSASNRWLGTVLLRRHLGHAVHDGGLNSRQRHAVSLAFVAAKKLKPDGPRSARLRLLKQITQRLYDAKLILRDS